MGSVGDSEDDIGSIRSASCSWGCSRNLQNGIEGAGSCPAYLTRAATASNGDVARIRVNSGDLASSTNVGLRAEGISIACFGTPPIPGCPTIEPATTSATGAGIVSQVTLRSS